MVCRSPSVERVAEKSAEATKALAEFAKMNKEGAQAYEAEFRKKIDVELMRAGITDQTFPLATGIDTQTEYASEFNIDNITGVVEATLLSLQAVTAGGPAGPTLDAATSPAAFDSYAQVVQSIGASLKSSSESSSTFTFQMTKIGPGIFAFISAQSANLKDVETFGEEAVSSITFVFTFAQSIQDIENTTGYEAARNAAEAITILKTKTLIESAIIASDTIIKLKQAQADLVDGLISGEFSVVQYDNLDNLFGQQIQVWEGRQNGLRQNAGFSPVTSLVLQKHITEDLDSVLLLKLKALTASGARCDVHSVAKKVLERVLARRAAAKPYLTLVSNYSLTAIP